MRERGNISKVLKCKLTKHVSPLIVYEKERLLSIKLHKGYLEHAHWTNILFTVMLYVFRHAATVEPIFPRLNLIRFDLAMYPLRAAGGNSETSNSSNCRQARDLEK